MASAAFVLMAGVISVGLATSGINTVATYKTADTAYIVNNALETRYDAYVAELAGAGTATTDARTYNGVTAAITVGTTAAGHTPIAVTATYGAVTKTENRDLTSGVNTHIVGYDSIGAPVWGTASKVTETRFKTAATVDSYSASQDRTFAIDAAGNLDGTSNLWAWGKNGLGDNSNAQSATPKKIVVAAPAAPTVALTVAKVVTDRQNSTLGGTCAITTTAVAYCWGPNPASILGVGSAIDPLLIPTAIPGFTWTSITKGSGTTCGISAADNSAYCWGVNSGTSAGAVGNGGSTDQTTPQAVADSHKYRWLETTGGTTCGVTTPADTTPDALFCWGYNEWGSSITPVLTSALTAPNKVVSADMDALGNVCILDTNKDVWCKGPKQTTFGSATALSSAARLAMVTGSYKFTSLQVNAGTACGLTTNATANVTCWGLGTNGQIGNGANNTVVGGTTVSSSRTFTTLTVGDTFNCAVDKYRYVYCWGNGANGTIGNNLTANQNVPTDAALSTASGKVKFADVTAGPNGVLAFDWKGRLYSWGKNTNGQAGVNSTAAVNLPTAVTVPSSTTPFTAYTSIGR
ncbi:hypothetical protein ASF30_09390 [Leifsonia sp. Leaf264]|nr:hypothetical protein ASF30_09390 [Leifsonia sp. Leaf264]